jgi:hypothetical protein
MKTKEDAMGKEVLTVDSCGDETIQVDGKEEVRLLTWDRVGVTVSDFGKSLGIDKLIAQDAIASIKIVIEAGLIAVMEVECYGKATEVLKRLEGEVSQARIRDNTYPTETLPPTYTVFLPLLSIEAKAFGPFKHDDCCPSLPLVVQPFPPDDGDPHHG